MLYRFQDYLLDTDTRALTRGGTAVVLTPKIYKTLLILLENHARVMTKEELCERIWPGQFVEEANLAQNISTLRRLLNEVADGQRYIGTLHGVGYRFLVTVVCDQNSQAPESEPLTPPSSQPLATPMEVIAERPQALLMSEERKLPQADDPPRPPSNKLGPIGAKRFLRWYWIGFSVLFFSAVFSAVKLWRARHISPPSTPVTHVTALTRLAGAQYDPAFSPDDSTLAFLNLAPDGQDALYIQRSDQLQPVKLQSGTDTFSSPVWSPDGRSIAFVRFGNKEAELILLEVATGKQRHLASLFPHRYGLPYRHLDWSSDGSMLVVDDKTSESDPLSLYVFYIKDGLKLRLSYPTMDIIGDVAPRFSPDGSRISFVRLTYQGRSDVFVVPVTRGEPTRITRRTSAYSDSGWLNDKTVLFSSRSGGRYSFWQSGVRADEEPKQVGLVESDIPIQFSVSRGGKTIAYSAYAANLDIWSIALDGPTAGAWKPVIATPGEDQAPRISPDGSKISFRSNVNGVEQIWVSNITGGNARPIDTGALTPAVHDWDADSRGILFNDAEGTGTYVAQDTGTPKVAKIICCHLSHPARSHDGKTIFGRTGHIIYQLNRSTGVLRKITDEGGSPMVQSADARYLYFSHGRMDSRISRVELSTGVQEDVVTDLLPGHKEAWALGNDGIYYLADRHGRPVISFHSLRTGTNATVSMFEGLLPAVGTSGFALTPDEHTLLVTRGEPIASSIQSFSLNRPEVR